MVLEIDGFDLTPYIVAGGVKWGRNDMESPKAGRTMDGQMHRDRIGMKVRLDVTCKPLATEDTKILLHAIFPEYVMVRYTDPMEGIVTKKMYSNNVPASHWTHYDDGTDIWDGIAFPLIEV